MPPPLRRFCLSLPPSLRTVLYQQQQQRAFSASSSRKSPLSEAILSCPTLLLDTIHSAGLPWHTAIPLSAILVRTFFVYRFSSLPARKAAIIRANLHPLSSARSRCEWHAYSFRTGSEAAAAAAAGRDIRGAESALIEFRLSVMRIWMAIRSSHLVGREFGAPLVSWWRASINLGALIAMTEAVRVKCGAREGLLSLLIEPFERHVDPERARRATMTADEIMVERLEAAYGAKRAAKATPESTAFLPNTDEAQKSIGQALQNTTSDHVQLPSLNTSAYASMADPTLRTEGLAWFPDLTVADTTLMLPLALSVTMAFAVLTRPKPALTPSSTSFSKKHKPPPTPDIQNSSNVVAALAALPPPKSPLDFLTSSQKIGLSLSMIFFFGAVKLPVGVLLYLVPNMAFGWLQSRWLDLKYPLPEMVNPCRRPVRVKIKKHFRNA